MSVDQELLRFRCTRCGNCCRDVRVPLTGADLARLVEATGSEPAELVQWLSAERVDIAGEPETLARLDQGFRLMVLRHDRNGCALLGEQNECTRYEARPAACRSFPFDASFDASGKLRRLKLIGGTDCDYARDGHVDENELRNENARLKKELVDYACAVDAWNRLQRRRLRMRRKLGSGTDFVSWLLARNSAF